jgi:hypothetical protein
MGGGVYEEYAEYLTQVSSVGREKAGGCVYIRMGSQEVGDNVRIISLRCLASLGS